MDGMQVANSNILRRFVYLWALKGDKSLKSPQIQSQRVYFSKISWVACPQTPSIGMLCMLMCFTHYDSAYLSYPHINNADTSGYTPLFKSLNLPLYIYK